MRDQMNRAALSIPSNIAEGAERDSKKEFIHFLNIAKGSAAELRTQIYISEKIGILDSDRTRPLIKETKEISSMLQGLINAQKKKLQNPSP
jgi:four helix bundle protein